MVKAVKKSKVTKQTPLIGGANTGNFGQDNSPARRASLAAQAQAASPYAPAKINTGVTAASKGSGRTISGGSFGTPWSMAADASLGTKYRTNFEAPAVPKDTSTPYDALLSTLGSGGSVDTSAYDQQTANTTAAGTAADAKLAALYASLQNSYNDDSGKIADQYAATRSAQSGAADDATNAITNAYSTSNNSLQQTLQNLGIGDALKVAANNGTTLQGDQAAALSGVAQNKAANLASTDANAAAAQDFNRQVGQSAALGGVDARAANLTALQKALQTIATARSSAVSSAAPSTADMLKIIQAQEDYKASQAKTAATNKATKAANKQAKVKIGLQAQSNATSAAAAKTNALANLIRQGVPKEEATKVVNQQFGG